MAVQRRDFLKSIGSAAAAWPLAARAQQPAMPVIGFLNSQSPDGFAERLRGFRQGLKETGYVEGETVTIEYRWADNQFDRLAALAADLVHRQVAVIVANGPAAAVAKAATTTIPIVFLVSQDPVRLGLVNSLARPGGNATGVNFFVGELMGKQLSLLRELVPGAIRVAVLINPRFAASASATADVESAAHAMGLQARIFNASHSREIIDAFTTIARDHHEALLVGPDPYFVARRAQLVTLAARHAIPTSYNVRDYVEAGGLMSYGTNAVDAYRQVGVYAGRILKGARPADLPVMQSSKFEFVINLATAMMLGIAVPPTLLARADEVIE
jgi:putative tryptophan/tyrosine transport system substrate-binding protein